MLISGCCTCYEILQNILIEIGCYEIFVAEIFLYHLFTMPVSLIFFQHSNIYQDPQKCHVQTNRNERVSNKRFVSLFAVNGEWTSWNVVTGCSVTCGNGVKKRTRSCSDPQPAYGGKPCPGNDTDYIHCHPMFCSGRSVSNN